MELLRVKNVGDETFTDSCNSVPYYLEPGDEQVVPYDAVVLWCGHPDADNSDPRNRVRVVEWGRLRVRYGVYEDADFARHIPHLEVSTLNGDRIHTVLDDPDGDNLTPAGTTRAQAITTEDQLSQLQAQVDALRQLLSEQVKRTAEKDDEDGDGDDEDGDGVSSPDPFSATDFTGDDVDTDLSDPSDDFRAPVDSPRTVGGK